MDKNIHLLVAKAHLGIAEEMHEKLKQEKDNDAKVAFRTAAAQNYFYAGISFMEAKLAESNLHSYSHENRARLAVENASKFSKELRELFDLVDRNLRNAVAYRAQNGKKYEMLRKFAILASEEIR
ncbi:MAG: hypothetical protein PHO02_00790 [Candidatus Nanoarchaeia archaeon]|nr:hypothetical protein [Candidatus Nanoarchaeia archaeon]